MQVTWTTPNAIDSRSRGAVPPQEPGRVAFRASGLGATSFLAVADLSADENDGIIYPTPTRGRRVRGKHDTGKNSDYLYV